MKRRLVVFVGLFCIAMMVASGAQADKPEKPPKPEKPDKTPGLTTECIIFTKDLDSEASMESAGDTRIVGCCPNAGPWPAYTMALHNMCYPSPDLAEEICLPDGPVDGSLFINSLGTGPTAQYKFQFWTWDSDAGTPGAGDFFVEIRGGTISRDRKAKILTVTFENETATVWVYYDPNPACDPSSDPNCDLCDGIDPACDPSSDPDCIYPCNTEETITNVGFELFRTSDLDYCQ